MKTRPRIRFLALIFTLWLIGLAPLPGQQPDEETIYARSRDFDLQHIRLELSFNFPENKVIGEARLRLAPIRNHLEEVHLDSAGLTIERVTLAGQSLTFRTADNQLLVSLGRAYGPTDTLELVIGYQAQPRRGLFFIPPNEAYPDRPRQIWSQGQASDNRHWFPSYDFPNDKTTSEMLVSVPADWVTVSNGRLVSVEENKAAKTKTWYWSQDKPHSTYLISLVAGEFETRAEDWNGIPLTYYVPQGTSGQISAAFGRTADMMEFFSRQIGPYPWDKYAQSVVEHFLYGGMENTSATTMARNWIYPASLAPDSQVSRDSGIAHELAHQWFGDLVTCEDWRHFWLNEGFATYFDELWTEHYYGAEEFAFRMQRSAARVTSSATAARYPIVRRPEHEAGPMGVLDYAKGAWVLHMVRHQLGDDHFWKAIRHYVEKHRFGNVDTDDFVDAVAEATGQDFEWLFDQYVYAPGHPEFEVSWDYDPAQQLVRLSVKQTRKREEQPAFFHLPVEVEITSEQGSRSFTLWVSKEVEEFSFPVGSPPRMVLFDRGNHLLKALTFKKSQEEWLYQLAHAPLVVHRIEAAQAAAKLARTPELLTALERAATSDAFYAVRAEVARSLRELKGNEAQRILLAMARDADPRVRAAAAEALGQFDASALLVAHLEQLAREDTSFTVRSRAIQSLGELKPEKGVDRIRPFLHQDAPQEIIRRAGVTALGALGDEAAVPLLLEWSGRGKSDEVRLAAIAALGRLRRGKTEVRDHLIKLLDDPYFRVRAAAVGALRQRREREAVPALEAYARNEWYEYAARNARRAIAEIQKPAQAESDNAEASKLRQRLTELEKETNELRERLKRLKERLGASVSP